MNLFPRRSYFLLAISMGPTSLYPDKPSPKNDPFFWYIEKEPQRPYDQNGGSIAPRSLIFDPIAQETVYQKTHISGGRRRRRRRRKNFPSQPDPIPSRRDIISRSGQALTPIYCYPLKKKCFEGESSPIKDPWGGVEPWGRGVIQLQFI